MTLDWQTIFYVTRERCFVHFWYYCEDPSDQSLYVSLKVYQKIRVLILSKNKNKIAIIFGYLFKMANFKNCHKLIFFCKS